LDEANFVELFSRVRARIGEVVNELYALYSRHQCLACDLPLDHLERRVEQTLCLRRGDWDPIRESFGAWAERAAREIAADSILRCLLEKELAVIAQAVARIFPRFRRRQHE
jgi:hypothetical protein